MAGLLFELVGLALRFIGLGSYPATAAHLFLNGSPSGGAGVNSTRSHSIMS
jgi:hypothetical protein